MPVVPSPSVPSIAPIANSGLPYQTAAGATPDAFGAGIGQAEQGFAGQIGSTGDMLEKHALSLQDDVNIASSNTLFAASTEKLGKLKIDFDSQQGANASLAYPQYLKDIAKVREEAIASAPNSAVAKQFDNDFKRRVGYTIVDGASHVRTQTRQFEKDAANAVKATTLQEIAANSKDDNRFETELSIGLDKTKEAFDYKGAAPETQKKLEDDYKSIAWATRLQAMAKTEPLRARELFTKNKDSIDGITQLKLDDSINQSIINVQSRVDSDKIVQSGALVSPNLTDRLKKLEGYNAKPYSDFKQTSSGFGTKAQPGDENIPLDQLRAIHEQRLNTELGRAANIVDTFAPGLPKGTRDALISLTYNAGSAWTSSGLGSKVRAGDLEDAKQNFAEYNQAGGTVNEGLVARRAAELSWWGGEPRDSDSTSQMGAALEKAKEQAIKVFPGDEANQAKYLDTLQNRIKSDFSVLQQSARDMQLQTRNIVQTELFLPDHSVTSYDRLSPKAQQAYDQAPPALQQSFQAAMRRNATADIPLTAERQSRFDTLRGESINEPDKFMSRDVSNEDLPRPQKSILLKAQADRKALVEKGTVLNRSMQAVQPLLNDAQIVQSKTDKSKQDEYNKFSGVFDKAIQDFTSEKKRPPNDKETREMGANLLKDIVISKGWFGDNTVKAYKVVADKVPVQVDSIETARALPSGTTFVLNGETRTRR